MGGLLFAAAGFISQDQATRSASHLDLRIDTALRGLLRGQLERVQSNEDEDTEREGMAAGRADGRERGRETERRATLFRSRIRPGLAIRSNLISAAGHWAVKDRKPQTSSAPVHRSSSPACCCRSRRPPPPSLSLSLFLFALSPVARQMRKMPVLLKFT